MTDNVQNKESIIYYLQQSHYFQNSDGVPQIFMFCSEAQVIRM